MTFYIVKQIARHYTKSILGSLCVYKLSRKPIFIFANRRGGSTLLMRMIYSQPGVDYIGEPMDFYNYHPHRQRFPRLYHNRLITLEPDEERLFFDYWRSLLEGRFRLRNQWNPFDPDFSFIVNRLVVKELYAKALMSWFVENFDLDIIYLTRHPVAVARSTQKLRWGSKEASFLENGRFCQEYLSPNQLNYCRGILATGTSLERYVLEWCLENLPALHPRGKRQWLTLTYEELVARPREISQLICSRFDLPAPGRMSQRALQPTRTAWGNSKKLINHLGPGQRGGQWVAEVGEEEIKRVQHMLDIFGIVVYSANDPHPAAELCHFGPLSAATTTRKKKSLTSENFSLQGGRARVPNRWA